MNPDKPQVIGVIPARYASVRLPAKPLIDLCGKTMIQRVYERAKLATLLDKLVVATDDERIAERVRTFGGEVSMTSATVKSGSDRVAAVARGLTLSDNSIFVNIQGDEPLIEPRMIDQAIQLLIDNPGATMGTLVKKITSMEELNNPGVVKAVFDVKMRALYFSRSSIPFVRDQAGTIHDLHFKHIGMYVYRRAFLLDFASWPETSLEQTEKLEQLRVLEHGHPILVGITRYDSIPIDTPGDAELVRAMIAKNHSNEI